MTVNLISAIHLVGLKTFFSVVREMVNNTSSWWVRYSSVASIKPKGLLVWTWSQVSSCLYGENITHVLLTVSLSIQKHRDRLGRIAPRLWVLLRFTARTKWFLKMNKYWWWFSWCFCIFLYNFFYRSKEKISCEAPSLQCSWWWLSGTSDCQHHRLSLWVENKRLSPKFSEFIVVKV